MKQKIVRFWIRYWPIIVIACYIAGLLAYTTTINRPAESYFGTPLTVTEKNPFYKLSQHFNLYIDNSSTSSIETILQKEDEQSDLFRPMKRAGHKYQSGAFWTKFAIENRSEGLEDLVISPETLEIESLELYELGQNRQATLLAQVGYHSFSRNEMGERLRYTLPLKVPTGESRTYYMKTVFSRQPLLTMYLGSSHEMHSFLNKTQTYIDFSLGIVAGITIFNIFLFLSTRDITYAYYLMFTISFFFCTAVNRGYVDTIFTNTLPFLKYNKYFLIMPALSAIAFSYAFLNAKAIMPRMAFTMKAIIALFSVAFFYGIWNPDAAGQISGTALLAASAVSLVSGILALIRGYQPSKYFLIAWGVMLASTLIWNLSNSGVLASDSLTNSLAIFGVSWDVVFMTLALSHRLSILEEDRHTIQIKKRENEILQQMFRIICHDISNPLTVINGGLRQLATPIDLDRSNYIVTKMNSASQAIKDIIESARKLEAIKSGKVKLQTEEVLVKDAIARAQLLLQSRLEEKGIKIVMDKGVDWDELNVMAHKASLSNDVFVNILSNAIKFSNHGAVITITASTNERGMVDISIRDRGIGMPQQIIDNIFDANHPTKRTGTDGERGTGFGMPIIKTLVESYHGEISIRSKEKIEDPVDHGTTVILTLPKKSGVVQNIS